MSASYQEAFDELSAVSIDEAPRFGAAAALFPESLQAQRFTASFWAPEVFFARPDGEGFYPGTRGYLDKLCSLQIENAPRVPVALSGAAKHMAAFQGLEQRFYFWSPELPEVLGVTWHRFSTVFDIFTWLFDGSGVSGRVARCLTSTYLLLLCLALPAGAQTAAVKGLARVVDGDTLEVAGQKVRLHGVDAPELQQTCLRAGGAPWHCGWTAAVRLEEMIGGRRVRCLGTEKDRYGRLIARCYMAGEHGPALDLGGAMVTQGLAVAYRKYSTEYANAEATAHNARAGIWAGTFVTPELWRKGVRK